jgi:(2Fe-2S) ferredoxin
MTVATRHPESGAVSSARRACGQVILCQGCCCGRTDRGFPEVPVDRIKAAWKSGRLNRSIQLTVSGCVGPCDVANVAVIVGPEGTSWFGGLKTHHYDTLIDWAQRCHAAGALLPAPPEFREHRFDWFVVEPRPAMPTACAFASEPAGQAVSVTH